MRGVTVVAAIAVLAALSCSRSPEQRAADLVAAARAEARDGSLAGAGRAVEKLDRALALLTGPGTTAARAAIHFELGELCTTTVDLERARRERVRAAELYHEAGDTGGELLARVHVARHDSENGTAADFVPELRALVARSRAAGAAAAEADATLYLGAAQLMAEDGPGALESLTAALPLTRRTGRTDSEAEVENQLGILQYNHGDPDLAQPHFDRVREIARATGKPDYEANAVWMTGRIKYYLRDDTAAALPDLEQALAAYERLGRTELAMRARLDLGDAQRKAGDARASVDTFTRLLAEARAHVPAQTLPILNSLGWSYKEAGMFADARKAYAESEAMARAQGQEHELHLALIGRARLAIAEERWPDALPPITEFLTAIAAWEAALTDERMRLSYAGAIRRGYQVLLEALAGAGDWNGAFAASEKLRARHLLAALGGREILDGRGAAALLDAGTTLVEYAFGDEQVFAFVVDAGGVTGLKLGKAKEVNAAVRRFYGLVSASQAAPAAEIDAAARALADLLLAPIAPRLRSERVAIVADMSLNHVPFAALPLPDGQPLLARHELVNLASASVLAEQRRLRPGRARPTRPLAVLADPIFDAGDARLPGRDKPPPAVALASAAERAAGEAGMPVIVRLPATRAEADAIAALAPGAFLALDAAASRAAAAGPEVASARIVHFATHGLLNDTNPELSGLIFSMVNAAGQPVDGFLPVPEIEKLRLSADLVVLSACRTALGKAFDGEGLVGVTRAFTRTGVPRVVSSLWDVDDAATAELMRRFYQNLLTDKLAPPAALRKAQLQLLADPRYAAIRLWAGFAVYGDWS